MEKIVVIGRFPHPGRKLEGMVQRIAAIDSQISATPRLYLDLYGFKNLKLRSVKIGNTSVVSSSFIRFFLIFKLIRGAELVYIHSIYFFALALIPIFFLNRRPRLILDLHGAVPEELEYSGKKLLAKIMAGVERYAFNRVDTIICVTRRMEKYYSSKYPNARVSYKYVPIFTDSVCQPSDPEEVLELRSKLQIPDNSIVFIYSGGLQAWQNIDKMLEEVHRIHRLELYWFIFCTNEEALLRERIVTRFGHMPERTIITHVAPEILRNFYALADYGFILRDDHILNRVANPTKLVEYLYFGIRPILLSCEIGDFFEMGFEFRLIGVDCEYNSNFDKSIINKEIALRIAHDSRSFDLVE